MKKIFIILFLIFSSTACAETLTREDVESAFLFHFVNYTEWNDNLPNYYICIPDDTDLRPAAAISLRGKVVNNRKVAVVSRSSSCHILVSQDVSPADDTTL